MRPFKTLSIRKIKNITRSTILGLFGGKTLARIRTIYWARELKEGRFSEKEINLLPRFVSSGDVCIDIGANHAQYTYPLSKLVGSTGKVFSFEPVKYTFKILKNIVKRLKLTNVRILNIALGDRIGEQEMVVPLDRSDVPEIGGACFWYSGKKYSKILKEKVKITTLDKLKKSLPLSRTTFIKCDVEGAEMMIFKGAKAFLSEYHPVILCEIVEKYTRRYGYGSKEIFVFLRNLGYSAFVFNDGSLLPIQKPQESIRNYIFVHNTQKYIIDRV